MPPKYHESSAMASRRFTAMAVLAFLVIGALLFALVDGHQTDVADEPESCRRKPQIARVRSRSVVKYCLAFKRSCRSERMPIV
jgi:hypothetical protein